MLQLPGGWGKPVLKVSTKKIAVSAAAHRDSALGGFPRGQAPAGQVRNGEGASVIVPTPMPTAHGVDPTVYIASWSLVDGTPD